MAVLFFIVFLDLVGFGVILPLLPFYGEHFGASPGVVTMLMAAYSIGQLFCSPIWGRLSDRFGRRPILLVSTACSALSYVWLGSASALWMLFGARLMAGIGAGNIAAAQAYIADVTPEEGRAKGMGMIGAAFGLGFTVGPALGGLVAGADQSMSRPAYLAAALSVLAFLGVLFILKESLPVEKRQAVAEKRPGRVELAKGALARPELRRLILISFILFTAFAGMETTFGLWAERAFGWHAQEVGLVFFYVGMVLVLVQGGLIGRLTKRYGEAKLLVAGAFCILVGLFGIPFSTTTPAVLIFSAFLALGMGLASPSINSLISRRAGETEQGGVMGVAQSASSLARIVGPAIAGIAFEFYGQNAPYYLGAALTAVVVVMALKVPAPAPRAAQTAAGN